MNDDEDDEDDDDDNGYDDDPINRRCTGRILSGTTLRHTNIDFCSSTPVTTEGDEWSLTW